MPRRDHQGRCPDCIGIYDPGHPAVSSADAAAGSMGIKKFVPQSIRTAIKKRLQGRTLQMGQAGQDLWVIGEVFNEKRGGFFVDIGAHDGVELSNSYVLEKRYGWTGICVEANPDSYAKLSANRAAKCVNVCLDEEAGTVQFSKNGMHSGIVGVTDEALGDLVTVGADTLDSVLEKCGAPTTIDYLSVDVEGAEDRVFAGFDLESYRITCLTVERPSEPLRANLRDAGFTLIKEIPGLDAFFLHESYTDTYLQNVFAFYKKRHVAVRWK